jgi:hypothetical protein
VNVESTDLVGVEIAKRLGVTRQAVSNWSQRYPGFPAPVVVLASGPVYEMSRISAWRSSRVPA